MKKNIYQAIRKSVVKFVIVFLFITSFITVTTAIKSEATTFVQTENAIEFNDATFTYPNVTNSKSYQVKAYKIGTSPRFKSNSTHYETKVNKIAPYKYKGIGYNLSTVAFLPVRYLTKKDNYSPQSMAFVDNYLYVLLTNPKHTNKGFFARFDWSKIKEKGLMSGSKLKRLRQIFHNKIAKKLTKNDKKLLKLIKIGPIIDVGHGQTLAYNPKAKNLWMSLDRRNSSGKLLDSVNTTFQRINLDTLKPEVSIKFRMTTEQGTKHATPYTMAFDKDGYGYYTRNSPRGYDIYRFTIKNNKVKAKLVQSFAYGPNPTKNVQAMSYNPYRQTLNIISNGAMMSIKVAKIGNLAPADFSYITFKTNREFETIQFDKLGFAHLLTTKGSEILKSSER
jgi:hypothetical protein